MRLLRDYAGVVAGAFCAVAAITLFLALLQAIDLKKAELILYGLTAVAVIAYTWVNWSLVRETEAQRETQIRPFVVVEYDPVSKDFNLVNVGNGAAINIEIARIYSANEDAKSQIDAHLRSSPDRISLLRPNGSIPLKFDLYVGETHGMQSWDFDASIRPGQAAADFIVHGSYQDIELRRFNFQVRTGKTGFRIIASSRV